MTDRRKLHMSWCQDDHSKDGECVIRHRVDMGDGERVEVELNGLRCDHFAIYLDNGETICDGYEVDEYVKGLAARLQGLAELANVVSGLRPLLDQSESLGEMDCDDSHNHD